MKLSVLVGFLFALLLTSCLSVAELSAAEQTQPPVYFVVFYSPGPNWNHNLTLNNQPGIELHRRYLNKLKDSGKLILGGHYLDEAGGMMIVQMGTAEEVALVAKGDPAVKSGVLQVEVKSWQADLSSVRFTRKRRQTGTLDRKQSFKIKSANQGSPINLEKEP